MAEEEGRGTGASEVGAVETGGNGDVGGTDRGGVGAGPGGPSTPDTTLFPEVTLLRPCSENICVNGHSWPPTMVLAKCGYGTPQGWNGCGAPVLSVRMENCPHCNEPVARLRLRTDHTGPARFPVPVCIPGSKSPAEIVDVILERTHYKQVEAKPKVEEGSKNED